MSNYGRLKSEEEWREYIDARLAALKNASYSGSARQHYLKMLRTMCYARVHGRMDTQQTRRLAGLLQQAVPRLRELASTGISIPDVIIGVVEHETGKRIQPA
jgi:hypothetical protein